MVGHETIRLNGEPFRSRSLAQQCEVLLDQACISECGNAPLRARGQEIPLLPDIAVTRQSDVFAAKLHALCE